MAKDNGEPCPPTNLCIIGNPNCGKTTLFNALTGAHQAVGNWPGVTVEKKIGIYQYCDVIWHVVDLPGIYSINGRSSSEDERIACNYVVSGSYSVIINIIDATSIERNLYLTSQLLELGIPMVIAVNMIDVAQRRCINVNTERLEQALGCHVVALVASRWGGGDLNHLKEVIYRTAQEGRKSTARPVYTLSIETAITSLIAKLSTVITHCRIELRWLAIYLLEGDPQTAVLIGEPPAILHDDEVKEIISATRDILSTISAQMLDILIADERYRFVNRIIGTCLHYNGVLPRTVSERIDRVVLDRFLGFPIFLVVVYLMFMFSIGLGGVFVDFFDQVVGILLVEGVGALLHWVALPTKTVTVLLADGLGGGIQTVATFIPIIGSLYLFLSFLEDSGYMARAAFVMDRGMRAIGLPGKAFVPLIIGFGCNVPAIMTTRTLGHRRDRLLTMMMVPFMSCGARLSVYVLFAIAFFPTNGQNIIFALYLIGVAFAVGTGLLLKQTFLAGDAVPFIMELPSYHIPTIATITLHTWHHLKDFILRAGKVIVPMVVALSILGTLGTDGSLGNRDSNRSVLASVSQSLMPIFAPMGLHKENWPAVVGLFSGIFAKEAVVGTLNILYSNLIATKTSVVVSNSKKSMINDKLLSAVLTIPANFSKRFNRLFYPLSPSNSFTTDRKPIMVIEGISIFSVMISRFDGAAGAFSYMLLVLLYAPCIPALGTINHEAGWRWAALSAMWGTGLSYIVAVVCYQIMIFERDPLSSGLWIASGMTLLGMAIGGIWVFSHYWVVLPSIAHK